MQSLLSVKTVEGFFDLNKPCPKNIQNCIELRNAYIEAHNKLVKSNCKQCDIAFLKANFISKIKFLVDNKYSIVKTYSKNSLKPYKLEFFTFCRDSHSLIYFYGKKIIFINKDNLVYEYNVLFKIEFFSFLLLVYRMTSNKIILDLIDNKSKKRIFTYRLS